MRENLNGGYFWHLTTRHADRIFPRGGATFLRVENPFWRGAPSPRARSALVFVGGQMVSFPGKFKTSNLGVGDCKRFITKINLVRVGATRYLLLLDRSSIKKIKKKKMTKKIDRSLCFCYLCLFVYDLKSFGSIMI